MRKRLTLLLLAMLACVGTWAGTYTIFNQEVGTFYDYFGTRAADKLSWTSGSNSGMAGFKISLTGSNVTLDKASSWALVVHSSAAETPYTMTLTAPDGYNITGYELTAQVYSSSYPNTYVLTAEDDTSQTINTTTLKTLSVSGLDAPSTDISIVAAAASTTTQRWLTMKLLTVTMEPTFAAIHVTYEQYVNGVATGLTATEDVMPGSSISIPNSLTNGYSDIAYDITTEGTIGNEDVTIKVNIDKKEGLVEELTELSNSKAYTMMSERGTFTVNGGNLANTVKSGYDVNNFAFITYEGNYYLWSIEAGKFVSCKGSALGDIPVAVTMTSVAHGQFKLQGGGLTLNSTSGFDTGAGFDTWTTTDEGNRCAIFEVADFDPTDVLAYMETFFNTKSIDFAVNVTGTTEAMNTRVGKITMALSSGSVSKYVGTESQESGLQYLDATFTATATSYRGYDFTGFSIDGVDYGTSIDLGELTDVPTGATLVANYTASEGNGLNLWYDYDEDNTAAYRIPALVRTKSGRLIAFSDYRPGKTDVGMGATSIERRYSDDGGETWSTPLTVAEGKWGVNTANVIEWSFGDAAVVADNTPGNTGNDVLMVCVGGNRAWTSSTYNEDVSQAQQGCVRWRSTDGGVTWSNYEYIQPALMQAFVEAGLRAADGSSGIVRSFFTSGKITQSVRKAEGAQYNRIYSAVDVNGGDVVVYSDDFGETWTVLGNQIANSGDEAHVAELPDGSLILVGRGSESRWINVFSYTDFDTAEGSWDTTGQWNNAVATSCNGDVEVIEAYDAYGDKNTVVVETAPMYSSQRRDIQYYFIALPKAEGFSVTDFSTVGGASWTQGMNVSHNWSAYSALLNNGDGTVDILFEDCAAGETASPSGYNIVYQKNHDIKDITLGQYFFDKEEAQAEGVRIPRPGHFYRFKGAASGAYLKAGNGTLTTTSATDAATIWYYAADGLVSYSTGRYLDCQAKALAAVGTSYAASVTENSNYEGTYYVRTNNYYCYSAVAGGNIDRGSAAGTQQGYAWNVEEVESLPVSITDLGLATLYSPVSLAVPSGVKVYAATVNETAGFVHFDEVEAVKAGVGVLVEADPGTYDLTIADTEADYESDLVGSVATVLASSIAADIYTLQSGPAFKKYSGTNVTGFRSHIETARGAGIKAFEFSIDDATPIGKIAGNAGEESWRTQGGEPVYNVAGQRIDKVRKGVNIVGGKKVLF